MRKGRRAISKDTPEPVELPIIDIEDDEQLVEEVTTTKCTGRQRREKPAEPETVTAITGKCN